MTVLAHTNWLRLFEVDDQDIVCGNWNRALTLQNKWGFR